MQKIVFIIFGIWFGTFISEEATWESILNWIRTEYPEIREISVEELKTKMDRGENIKLFDVRELEEFQVSHIKGAKNINNAQDIAKIVKDKKAMIICYCSVGYRSGNVVKDLFSLGFHNTYNLRGSIFEWANKGNSLFKNGEQTSFVHPFNKKWGKLLKQELRKN